MKEKSVILCSLMYFVCLHLLMFVNAINSKRTNTQKDLKIFFFFFYISSWQKRLWTKHTHAYCTHITFTVFLLFVYHKHQHHHLHQHHIVNRKRVVNISFKLMKRRKFSNFKEIQSNNWLGIDSFHSICLLLQFLNLLWNRRG